MNPLSRQDWKRSARQGGEGWNLTGWFVLIAIIVWIIRELIGK